MRTFWWSGQWQSDVVDLVNSCPSRLTAKAYENRVYDLLTRDGWTVGRQFPVPDRGDGRRGRVDIVAEKRGIIVAIELDRITPRVKSIIKVQSVPNAIFRLVFCREYS